MIKVAKGAKVVKVGITVDIMTKVARIIKVAKGAKMVKLDTMEDITEDTTTHPRARRELLVRAKVLTIMIARARRELLVRARALTTTTTIARARRELLVRV